MKDTGYVISKNIVISPGEIECVKKNEATHQVLKPIPVMLIKREKLVYVNLHEFVYTPGALEAFLLSTDPKQYMIIDSEVPNPNQKESDANQEVGNKLRGQPSIASKFPTLVDSAEDFVKQHSFVVQIRS